MEISKTSLRDRLFEGRVIPAHPLALTREHKLDERRQRALTRYYLEAGAGGVAVGVHTTQFAIRDPKVGLLEPVLSLAMDVIRSSETVKIAGACGRTPQAIAETELAASLGYEAVLLSLGAFQNDPVPVLIEHVRAVASVMPVFGFYLQPAVGGRVLSYEFWRQFAEIENVVAIKVAAFNRYQTLDVVRAVAESGRARDIALYTGNDDNIFVDLLSDFEFSGQSIHFAGGLLGHWAVWTRTAVQHLALIQETRRATATISSEMLVLAQQITDANAALFDPANQFQGCIAGIHEVLCRQEFLEEIRCLDTRDEALSSGQQDEIDRVCLAYPYLNDDQFVKERIDGWMS